MIDVCMIIHRNYEYLPIQIEHWRSWIRGEWRLLVLDNTPEKYARNIPADDRMDVMLFVNRDQPGEFDGESHGRALDFLVSKAESKIVGLVDSDFFWFDPDVLAKVNESFAKGVRCWGSSLEIDDWRKPTDPRLLVRPGSTAPAGSARSSTSPCPAYWRPSSYY